MSEPTFYDKTTTDATFTRLGSADTDLNKVRALTLDVDGRTQVMTYTNGLLTQIVESSGGTTVKTTTLAYTGTRLNTVTEVAGGTTVVTTMNYDVNNVFTGTTRTVS